MDARAAARRRAAAARRRVCACTSTGAREWRGLRDWPPPRAARERLHLQPGGGLDAAAPAGVGRRRAIATTPPIPTPAVGGPVLLERKPVRRQPRARAPRRRARLHDDAAGGRGRGDRAGRRGVFVRSSSSHFDVFVRVCEVDPTAVAQRLRRAGARHARRRARCRRRRPRRVPAVADGAPLPARPPHPRAGLERRAPALRAQHRDRRAAATATRLVPAEQEVFHDPEHPSAVTLTVL